MSQDSFTEVTRKSWGGRLGSAFSGIVVGALLFIGSFVLLFWNEGRSVQTAKSLNEGKKTVIDVPAAKVADANEGKLVHLSGPAMTGDTLRDNDFNIAVNAVKLQRKVQMLQWKEKSESKTHKKMGGGEETVTTYNYIKVWSDRLINSGSFKNPGGHENPGTMPYESSEQAAAAVTLGGFSLGSVLIGKMDNFEDLPLSNTKMPEKINATVTGNVVFIGASQQSPQIGDLKISFRIVKPAVVSVVARQSNGSLEPYQTSAGRALALLQAGDVQAAAMFETAKKENAMWTWLLRLIGLIAMAIGLMTISKPLSVLGDVVPFRLFHLPTLLGEMPILIRLGFRPDVRFHVVPAIRDEQIDPAGDLVPLLRGEFHILMPLLQQ